MLDKIRDIINSDNVTRIAQSLQEPSERSRIIDTAIENLLKRVGDIERDHHKFMGDILAYLPKLEDRLQQLESATNVPQPTFDNFWLELEHLIYRRCRPYTQPRITTTISERFKIEGINTLELVHEAVELKLPRIGPMAKQLIRDALAIVENDHVA